MTYERYVMDIHAGSPMQSCPIEEKDVRTCRTGFFAGLRRTFGSKILTQLTVLSRPYSNLLVAKQV